MTDQKLLKAVVYSKGYTFEKLAEKLGMTNGTMSNKVHGKTAFTVPEIIKISNILDLSQEEREYIFFKPTVETVSTRIVEL